MDMFRRLVRKATHLLLAKQNKTKFPQILDKWLTSRNGIRYIDVGSNRGQFAKIVLENYRLKRCWLIEPQSHLCEGLERTFCLPVFSVHTFALAKTKGVVTLEVSSQFDDTASTLKMKTDIPELSHLELGEKYYTDVSSISLDQFTSDLSIDYLDLIKIDTQGNELTVLGGGIETIKRSQAIWIEMSFVPLYEGSCLLPDVVQFLHNQGLWLRDIVPEFRGPSGELLQVNGLFTRDKV